MMLLLPFLKPLKGGMLLLLRSIVRYLAQ